MRLVHDLTTYSETPAHFTQYHLQGSTPSKKKQEEDVFFLTVNPNLLQLITPESRAFTAGYILSDVLIKNLTVQGPFCHHNRTTKMKEILELAIALNTTSMKEAKPGNQTWLNELIAATSSQSSPLHICQEESSPNLQHLLTSIVSYRHYCCHRDDGTIDDPNDSFIVCQYMGDNYKLVDMLEALCVLFLLLLALHWLQVRFQRMIHIIRSNSLIFTYITGDYVGVLGKYLPHMLLLRPFIDRLIKYHHQWCGWCGKRKLLKLRHLESRSNTLPLRISAFILNLSTMFWIILLGFLRFILPAQRPTYTDSDKITSYASWNNVSSLLSVLEANYSFNGYYLIVWGAAAVVFLVTMLLQVYGFNVEHWFDYVDLEEERNSKNSQYLSQLFVLTQLWTVIMCGLFVIQTWIFITYWSVLIKLLFSIVGVGIIVVNIKVGLTFPKYIPHASVPQRIFMWSQVFVSFLIESLTSLAFIILAYLAANTFFSLVWYNVLNVVLYSSRIPVIIFCATLAIIFQNMIRDTSMPFEVFYSKLLERCTDCVISLCDSNVTLAKNESKMNKVREIQNKKPEIEKQKEYHKITLSPEQLEMLLTIPDDANPVITDPENFEEYYVVTLEMCNKIYSDVLSRYSRAPLVHKYLLCIVVSTITFVAFWYISVFNNFAGDQLPNVAILATGFLPTLLGAGAKELMQEYFDRRIDGAIASQLEERDCPGIKLGVLYHIRDRYDIWMWLNKLKQQQSKMDVDSSNCNQEDGVPIDINTKLSNDHEFRKQSKRKKTRRRFQHDCNWEETMPLNQ